jgi:exosortase
MALFFGALWFVLCRHLSAHWNLNPQYGYGWIVPPLAAYLAARRWTTRPAASAPLKGMGALVIAGALVFGALWLVEAPNPDWRLISWLLALLIAGMSLATLAALGGRAWAAHFAFPILFTLTAVPWPTGIEIPVVQNLMRIVAMITVEALNFFHVPALQQGNVIEIGAGLLGVDEACSGVRSLQATLMASLFLGELYSFTFGKRLVLLVAGLIVALLTNVARTFFLAWNAAKDGLDAVEKWHDPAGFTILTGCLVVVWLLALLLDHDPAEVPATPPDARPSGSWSTTFAAALCAWLAVVFVGTELWFSRNEVVESQWQLTAPAGSEKMPLPPATVEMLQFDQGVARTWKREDGVTWVMYFFEWKPGPVRSRILARMHRPENCLPAAGLLRAEERGIISVDAGGFRLPFQASRYETRGGEPIFVYFCPWQNRTGGIQHEEFSGSAQMASLRAVLRGERRLGQQVAQFAAFGFRDAAKADAALRAEVEKLIQPTGVQPAVPK